MFAIYTETVLRDSLLAQTIARIHLVKFAQIRPAVLYTMIMARPIGLDDNKTEDWYIICVNTGGNMEFRRVGAWQVSD